MNVSKGSKKAEDKNFYEEIRLWHKSRNHENTGVVKGYAISLILPPISINGMRGRISMTGSAR